MATLLYGLIVGASRRIAREIGAPGMAENDNWFSADQIQAGLTDLGELMGLGHITSVEARGLGQDER